MSWGFLSRRWRTQTDILGLALGDYITGHKGKAWSQDTVAVVQREKIIAWTSLVTTEVVKMVRFWLYIMDKSLHGWVSGVSVRYERKKNRGWLQDSGPYNWRVLVREEGQEEVKRLVVNSLHSGHLLHIHVETRRKPLKGLSNLDCNWHLDRWFFNHWDSWSSSNELT